MVSRVTFVFEIKIERAVMQWNELGLILFLLRPSLSVALCFGYRGLRRLYFSELCWFSMTLFTTIGHGTFAPVISGMSLCSVLHDPASTMTFSIVGVTGGKVWVV